MKITKNGSITVISNKPERVTIGYIVEGKMIRVAVSYCSATDKFKRKAGRENVLERMRTQWDTITLPLGKMREDVINDVLNDMFTFNF